MGTPAQQPVVYLYDFDANGSFVTPQMARNVREKAPLAIEVRVSQTQMNKIVEMYDDVNNSDVTIDPSGLFFGGLQLKLQLDLPETQMGFYDARGNLVAKIRGLER